MQRPFDPDDLSYASIVAAFLQARYQQRWQSERMLYQSQHDSLTGIVNRTHFRADMREACLSEAGCSFAVVDLIDFSGVNQRFGNLTGDAVLVEVAAALAGTARNAEFVGRLGGDAFGIGLPGVTTESALLKAAGAVPRGVRPAVLDRRSRRPRIRCTSALESAQRSTRRAWFSTISSRTPIKPPKPAGLEPTRTSRSTRRRRRPTNQGSAAQAAIDHHRKPDGLEVFYARTS